MKDFLVILLFASIVVEGTSRKFDHFAEKLFENANLLSEIASYKLRLLQKNIER